MTVLRGPMCFVCTHFKRTDENDYYCAAFPLPEGIPSDIILSEFDHRNPHEGDHGIQFELKPGTSPERAKAYTTGFAPFPRDRSDNIGMSTSTSKPASESFISRLFGTRT